MSFNGSGTFNINSTGQPVVTGTSISSTVFNALTADLATGLSTCITKDGQTASTVRIPFAGGIDSTLTTDSTSVSTGSIITEGGLGVAKAAWIGGLLNVAGLVTMKGAAPAAGSVRLTITETAGPVPTVLTGTVVHIVGADASTARVSADSFGGICAFELRRANGSAATPTALVAGNNIGNFSAFGYGDTAYSSTNRASVALTADENWSDAAQGTRIVFNTTPNGTAAGAAEVMRITNAGFVGIGATPAVQFHTTGNVRLANFGAGTATFDASGNISSVSDMRDKDKQGDYKWGLDELMQIFPILFKWNQASGLETEHTYAGFSAQELQTVLPFAVFSNKKTGKLSLYERAISCALVNAVKELKTKYDTMEARLAALEAA